MSRMCRIPHWGWPNTWYDQRYWSMSPYYDTCGELKKQFRYANPLFALVHKTMDEEARQAWWRFKHYEKWPLTSPTD